MERYQRGGSFWNRPGAGVIYRTICFAPRGQESLYLCSSYYCTVLFNRACGKHSDLAQWPLVHGGRLWQNPKHSKEFILYPSGQKWELRQPLMEVKWGRNRTAPSFGVGAVDSQLISCLICSFKVWPWFKLDLAFKKTFLSSHKVIRRKIETGTHFFALNIPSILSRTATETWLNDGFATFTPTYTCQKLGCQDLTL